MLQRQKNDGRWWTGWLRLTRWNEHILFTLPAVLLGVDLALDQTGAPVDGRVVVILLANVLAVTFAFVINDIEDAPDDARDPARAARNAVAAGMIARGPAWALAWGVAGISLILFAVVNARALALGGLGLLLGWLYSWRRVRLKAFPVVDVLSHVLMLSALLFLTGYATYARDFGAVLWVTFGTALISAYGQLYNQLRDYALDRAAGLHNSASLLGARGTQYAMHASLGAAALSLVIALLMGVIPLGLVGLLILLAPLVLILRSGQDMRGSEALDASGRLQNGAMIVATLALLLWLAIYALW